MPSVICLPLVSWVVSNFMIIIYLCWFLTGFLVLGMQGKLGHAAWRWLFFIEGSLTVRFANLFSRLPTDSSCFRLQVAVAIIAIFILPDFPETTTWLSPMERRLAQVRMAEEVGESDHDTKEESVFTGLILAVKDWRVWFMSLALTSQVRRRDFAPLLSWPFQRLTSVP